MMIGFGVGKRARGDAEMNTRKSTTSFHYPSEIPDLRLQIVSRPPGDTRPVAPWRRGLPSGIVIGEPTRRVRVRLH